MSLPSNSLSISSCLVRFTVLGWAFLLCANGHGDTVSFDTSIWDHNDGNGSHVAWTDGEFFGETTVGGANLLVTSTALGSTTYTADHFSRIDASFFTGFAFQLDPGTTLNTTNFTNYARYDFEFNAPVQLDSFTLTDVDRANNQWYDVIAAEGFSTSNVGAVGTGFSANYTFAPTTNMETFTEFNLFSARPVASSGNVQNTPENDVTFDFTQPIQSFSIYHWNDNATDSGAATQTIGIRGNEFEVTILPTSVPEPHCISLFLVLSFIATVRRHR